MFELIATLCVAYIFYLFVSGVCSVIMQTIRYACITVVVLITLQVIMIANEPM